MRRNTYAIDKSAIRAALVDQQAISLFIEDQLCMYPRNPVAFESDVDLVFLRADGNQPLFADGNRDCEQIFAVLIECQDIYRSFHYN